jgi:hypothetical protein
MAAVQIQQVVFDRVGDSEFIGNPGIAVVDQRLAPDCVTIQSTQVEMRLAKTPWPPFDADSLAALIEGYNSIP